VPATPVLIAL
jgi:hypothetical protein